MTIGERIKTLRIKQGLTQKELAEKCGMFDSAIRRYESGRQNPKKETIEKIATALDTTVIDLMFDREEGIFKHDKQITEQLGFTFPDIYAGNEEVVLHYFNKLNRDGKNEAIKRIEELTQIPKYTTPDED